MICPPRKPDSFHAAIAAAVARVAVNGPKVPLSRCANLAPAGTGTTAIAKEWLQPMFIRARSTGTGTGASSSTSTEERPGYVHHRHDLNLSHLYALGARCFIISLRRPSERLTSTFLHDQYLMHGLGGVYSRIGRITSPSRFVSARRIEP